MKHIRFSKGFKLGNYVLGVMFSTACWSANDYEDRYDLLYVSFSPKETTKFRFIFLFFSIFISKIES